MVSLWPNQPSRVRGHRPSQKYFGIFCAASHAVRKGCNAEKLLEGLIVCFSVWMEFFDGISNFSPLEVEKMWHLNFRENEVFFHHLDCNVAKLGDGFPTNFQFPQLHSVEWSLDKHLGKGKIAVNLRSFWLRGWRSSGRSSNFQLKFLRFCQWSSSTSTTSRTHFRHGKTQGLWDLQGWDHVIVTFGILPSNEWPGAVPEERYLSWSPHISTASCVTRTDFEKLDCPKYLSHLKSFWIYQSIKFYQQPSLKKHDMSFLRSWLKPEWGKSPVVFRSKKSKSRSSEILQEIDLLFFVETWDSSWMWQIWIWCWQRVGFKLWCFASLFCDHRVLSFESIQTSKNRKCISFGPVQIKAWEMFHHVTNQGAKILQNLWEILRNWAVTCWCLLENHGSRDFVPHRLRNTPVVSCQVAKPSFLVVQKVKSGYEFSSILPFCWQVSSFCHTERS